MDCVYISEGNYLWKHNDAVIYLRGICHEENSIIFKVLSFNVVLTVWIIIMFFTDYMNSQSVKLYCMFVVGCGCAYSIWEKTYVPDARSYIAEKAIALILIVTVFIQYYYNFVQKYVAYTTKTI